ncbi:hypothetical protein BKA82DRAFT_999684 [Pisolithus tinctorius]|uniref:Uncharacterized protein n=1 Tax=Pisolithus tinctorius Marx 270 TaxID=870435 RepID=A0A0C3NXC8_PISTI|nr:hypothetical protein BKA82DRAFT_999684 [Pisolithus tinctorius]KIO05500.1 hypothetical protein M404DRAFT_999684 [Pisolithus tinctorius Marx 270]
MPNPGMLPAATAYTPTFTPMPGLSRPMPCIQAQNLSNSSTPHRIKCPSPCFTDAFWPPRLELVPDPSLFPAEGAYTHLFPPTSGQSFPTPITQTQNLFTKCTPLTPSNPPTPSALQRSKHAASPLPTTPSTKRTRGRQVPVSLGGNPVRTENPMTRPSSVPMPLAGGHLSVESM